VATAIFGLALLAAVAWCARALVTPLVTPAGAAADPATSGQADHEVRVELGRLLEALAEADHDHAMKKLAGQDHVALRDRLSRRAAALLKAWEVLRGPAGPEGRQ